MLKCLSFLTNPWYYVDSPKYKALLDYHINITLTKKTKHWPMNHENEVRADEPCQADMYS